MNDCLADVNFNGSQLDIVFNENLTCKNWGQHWGNVYEEIINKIEGKKKLEINLSGVTFADPMVLMSIILDLNYIKDSWNVIIDVLIPVVEYNKDNNYTRGIFLKYLASQGFLGEMFRYGFHIIQKKENGYKQNVKERDIERFTDYKYIPLLSGNIVHPVRICVFEKAQIGEKNINAIIKSFINEIKSRIKDNVSFYTYTTLVEQVYNILYELIDNAFQHAYENPDKIMFAFYIRSRFGAESYDNAEKINAEITREKNNCPAANEGIYAEKNKFLEVFFVDRGVGLKHTMLKERNSKGKPYKYSFTSFLGMIMANGYPRYNKEATTPFGGLHFICRLLKENGGYIWANEGSEWINVSAERMITEGMEEIQGNTARKIELQRELLKNEQDFYPRGLHWCFRIPYCDNAKVGRWLVEWKGKMEEHPALDALRYKEDMIVIRRIVCFDERDGKAYVLNGNWNQFSQYDLKTIKDVKVPKISGKITCVCFLDGYKSKNETVKRICDYLEIAENFREDVFSTIDLILADVYPDKLFGLAYCIDGLRSERFTVDAVGDIAIVSRDWKAVHFNRDENGIYTTSRKNSENFFDCVGKEIIENAREFALFLKRYDSFRFWERIIDHESDGIYINATINWEDRVLDGYLDLERVGSFLDVYEIIENALKRLIGVCRDNDCVFKSIDQTALRVCQNINASINSEGDNNVVIKVCGASVTGYTMGDKSSTIMDGLKVTLFDHSGVTSVSEVDEKEWEKKDIDKNAPVIFIWPGKEITKRIPKSNTDYYRLGKTSLISTEKSKNLIDITNIYEGVVRNKQEMYVDLQREYPRIVKYGHFCTDEHHYLIGFDFLTYMKYCYLKKEEAFLFLLFAVLKYLCGDKYELVRDKQLSDPRWGELLKECNYKWATENEKNEDTQNIEEKEEKEKKEKRGCIVVYHSNTVIDYTMQKIKLILPISLRNKIIPVSLYDVQMKGCPITFSPLIEGKLRLVLEKEKKDKNVMYVDSSFYTGRRMLEVENTFYKLGYQKVLFLSIMDMRRLTSSDSNSISYWKANIPRMDEKNCLICEALSVAAAVKGKVTHECELKINEWERNWNCRSVVNSDERHGIVPQVIQRRTKTSNIYLKNSAVLNMFYAEHLCESFDNEAIDKIIKKDGGIPTGQLKIQLICTQLSLYGNQYSRQLQHSLLKELITLMSREEKESPYTSLGGLVLITQSEEMISEVLNDVLIEEKKTKSSTIISLEKSNNGDLVAAFAILSINFNSVEKLLNKIGSDYKGKSFFTKVNDSLLPNHELKNAFQEFIGLLKSEKPEVGTHATNYAKLKERTTNLNDLKIKLRCAYEDIKRMCELLAVFPARIISSRGDSINIERLSGFIKDFSQSITDTIDDYKYKEENGTAFNDFILPEKTKALCREFDNITEKVIRSYYISTQDNIEEYLNDLIKRSLETIKNNNTLVYRKNIDARNIQIKIDNPFTEKKMCIYYFWNQSVEKEFEYLIDNIRHCQYALEQLENNEILMEIIVKFRRNRLILETISISNKTRTEVRDSFTKKGRLSKNMAVSTFEIRIVPKTELLDADKRKFRLTVTMSVPACIKDFSTEDESDE